MDKVIKKIEEKVYSNVRISDEDALYLYGSGDIIKIGEMADHARKRIAGEDVYYSHSLNINPTNICRLRCDLCAFSRSEGEEGAYEQTSESILKNVREVCGGGDDIFEAHIVGGLNPKYGLDFYENLLKKIKALRKNITIQAFTAVEIDFLAKESGVSIEEVLKRLKNAGLDSMPGGGAEIFNDAIRKKICAAKINSKRWLDVMKAAHEAGIPTNATMLYGHIETDADRVTHMRLLRELQDATGGFKCFVPLAFYEKNTKVKNVRGNTGHDDLKVIAIARIYLDNFPNVKALYTTLGLKFAQIALMFGASDLGGTSLDERIVKAAGAGGTDGVTETDLINIIKGAGRVPVRTDSTYTTGRKRRQ